MYQPQDLYELLQVSPHAELDVIQAEYKRIAARYSPNRDDSHEAAEMMRLLNDAYEVLSDPEGRAEYDRSRSADIVPSLHVETSTTWQSIKDTRPGRTAR